MVAEAIAGTATCTAGGFDGPGVVVCGGTGTTGCVIEAGGDAGSGNLVLGAAELPPCREGPAVGLREDHGSRRRLANLGRFSCRASESGSKLVDCCLPDRGLENICEIFGILGIINILAVGVFKISCTSGAGVLTIGNISSAADRSCKDPCPIAAEPEAIPSTCSLGTSDTVEIGSLFHIRVVFSNAISLGAAVVMYVLSYAR